MHYSLYLSLLLCYHVCFAFDPATCMDGNLNEFDSNGFTILVDEATETLLTQTCDDWYTHLSLSPVLIVLQHLFVYIHICLIYKLRVV